MARIMIVDDDTFMHRVFERILKIAGHDVVEHAFDGQDAVEKFSGLSQQPDIIIMDHRMPTKNGVDATLELMTISSTIVILFVSADESIHSEALEAGAIGFLVKPIRSKDLISAISDALQLAPSIASS